MRKYGLLLGIVFIGVMLFTACENFESSETQTPIKNGYGRISIILSERETESPARTVFPQAAFSKYTYTFTKNGAAGVEIAPGSDGFFILEAGSYTVVVQAYVGNTGAYTLAASGVSGQFSVGSGDNAPIRVPLYAVTGVGKGKFYYSITYPYGADAEITLQKYPDMSNILLTSNNTPNGYGKTQALELDAGSYLLTVIVSKNELYAGLIEAIHIYSGIETEYSKDFTDADLLAKIFPTASDYIITTGAFIYNGSEKAASITRKANASTGAVTILYNGTQTVPVNAGTYTVTFNVAAAGGFYAATGLPAGVITIYEEARITSPKGIEFIWVVDGSFQMGSNSGFSSEKPVHTVTLSSGFYMGKYEVTQEQWTAVMGNNPSSFESAVTGESGTPNKLPVERVSWYDTLVFCNKLSMLEKLSPAYRISGSTDPAVWGTVPATFTSTWDVEIVAGSNGYRLPTEAEWEYACRAGTTTSYNTGATISDNTGWNTSNNGSKTHEVGKKPANAWGLYDMHGNVGEWCWDWYGSYSSGAQTDPMGAFSGSNRVVRGGSWVDTNYSDSFRSACRSYNAPYLRHGAIGFRLVRF